ncbi:amidase family protein [Yinghuangia aomiensis]
MTVWINRYSEERVRARERSAPADGPLAGVRFAVKDNLDVAGLPTTAACPALADRVAEADAEAVARLAAAGAVPVGKTNMDQFATGLVGTRSPRGACHSVFAADHVSGGSSSGSAVAVARGDVPLALGTDTAGSRRVPAALQRHRRDQAGARPGVRARPLPACRSLDCVTAFTCTVAEGRAALRAMAGFRSPRPVVAGRTRRCRRRASPHPCASPPFRPDRSTWIRARRGMAGRGGAGPDRVRRRGRGRHRAVPGRGPAPVRGTVARRAFRRLRSLLTPDGPHLDPTVRRIALAGRDVGGADRVRGPGPARGTAARDRAGVVGGRHADDAGHTGASDASPRWRRIRWEVNARLGTYTNFVNLLDLAAVAVPAGTRADGLAVRCAVRRARVRGRAAARRGGALVRGNRAPTRRRLPAGSSSPSRART